MELLTEQQAAKVFGLAVQTLRNHRMQRKGCPYIKMGKFVRYRQEDIEKYVEKNRIDPEGRKK